MSHTHPMPVVLFDLDDTLFQHSACVAAGVLAHRRAQAGPIAAADDAAELERWLALEEHHYHRYLGGEIGFLEQRRERARAFVAPHGIDLSADADADAWFGEYLDEYRAVWSLHDDVLPALDTAAEAFPGVRFGIITNATLAFQMQKLAALDLVDRMEHVVASAEFGVAKPDPAIFLHACTKFGVEPADAIYVGDRLHTDAIGAASAGLVGVWLLREREAKPDEVTAAEASGVRTIGSLAELAGLLAP